MDCVHVSEMEQGSVLQEIGLERERSLCMCISLLCAS